jgi:hypothetical protein
MALCVVSFLVSDIPDNIALLFEGVEVFHKVIICRVFAAPIDGLRVVAEYAPHEKH